MGRYFNPNSDSFTVDKNDKIYIDKTELIGWLNEQINTPKNCIAVSRASDFGKSHAARMIAAYYSIGSKSETLFDDTKLANDLSYKQYLNKFNLIHLDISSVWDSYQEDILEYIRNIVSEDIKNTLEEEIDYNQELYLLLWDVYKKTGIHIVVIIDEWDCVIRNSDDQELIHRYLQFLHSLFKSEESKAYLALAYITGIIPIKINKDETGLNNFREYTMIKSKPISEFYGFTEKEVKALCCQYGMDYETTKNWYDGYLIDGRHMYNPNSVLEVMINKRFDLYWKNTSSLSSINSYITMNCEGLKDDITTMMSGKEVMVETGCFQNDLANINSKDDVLTALVHLGYLTYNAERQSVFIPNYEVSQEFQVALKNGRL